MHSPEQGLRFDKSGTVAPRVSAIFERQGLFDVIRCIRENILSGTRAAVSYRQSRYRCGRFLKGTIGRIRSASLLDIRVPPAALFLGRAH